MTCKRARGTAEACRPPSCRIGAARRGQRCGRRLNTGPPAPVEKWVLVDCAGWRRVVRLATGYDDALAEAGEGGQSVGAALDHLDLVDHAFGVPVRGRLLEVGQ